MGGSDSEELHKFHLANIHERRWAAFLVRCVPLGILVLTVVLVLLGVFLWTTLLLFVCAALNVLTWLWICSMAGFGIFGAFHIGELLCEQLARVEAEQQAARGGRGGGPKEALQEGGGGGGLQAAAPPLGAGEGRPAERPHHIVVFPNYDEEESMLRETLQCIREAEGSETFWVCLGMEERESTAREKGERLQASCGSWFGRLIVTYHPGNLMEDHKDGSRNPEVAGKASNLKWAVREAYKQWKQDPNYRDDCILTVADADCLMHPSYFRYVSDDYQCMKEGPGDQHHWSMWQAPQLPYRNYWESPAPSRAWGYISSAYELGGVASLRNGGHHMVFSAYSLWLQLGIDADLWDGDVIAEDHHAFVKGFMYSVLVAAQEQRETGAGLCRPKLRVRPVMLPVKSTSVLHPDGTWKSWMARWNQARRHCQGVAEVSYILLACWDMLWTLPLQAYSLHFVMTLQKVITRLLLIHVCPLCQAIALAVLTLYWLWKHGHVPGCPTEIWMASGSSETLLCGLAGAWVLTWPVVIPVALMAIANFCFITKTFTRPQNIKEPEAKLLWYKSDAGIDPFFFGSKSLSLAARIIFDCAVWLAPLMVPYGLIAAFLASVSVMLSGNNFQYDSAAKATTTQGKTYGTMDVPDTTA